MMRGYQRQRAVAQQDREKQRRISRMLQQGVLEGRVDLQAYTAFQTLAAVNELSARRAEGGSTGDADESAVLRPGGTKGVRGIQGYHR